jgi:hypothetical protein
VRHPEILIQCHYLSEDFDRFVVAPFQEELQADRRTDNEGERLEIACRLQLGAGLIEPP